jgi:hypothetical protein
MERSTFETQTAMTNGLRGWTAASALTLGLILSGLLMLTPAKADGITDGNAGRDALLEGRLDDAIHLFTRAMTLGGLNARNGAITLNLRGNAYPRHHLRRTDRAQ